MKTFFILFIALFSLQVNAATTITMGGRVFPGDPASYGNTAGKYKTLRGGGFDGATGRAYGGLGDATSLASASAWQVPSGLTFTILAWRIMASSSTAAMCQFVYGDTAVLTYGTGSAPTNVVYQGGSGASIALQIGPSTAGARNEGIENWTIPANKYPAVNCYQGNGQWEIIGVLQ